MRCLCLRLKTKASPVDVTLLADHWASNDLNSKQRCAKSAMKYKETDHYYNMIKSKFAIHLYA